MLVACHRLLLGSLCAIFSLAYWTYAWDSDLCVGLFIHNLYLGRLEVTVQLLHEEGDAMLCQGGMGQAFPQSQY